MHNRQWYFLAILALAALALFAACSKEDPTPTAAPTVAPPQATQPALANALADTLWGQIKARGKIVVGTSADYPPFEFYRADFQLDGFDIALIHDLAARLGLAVEIKDMAFEGLDEALMLGQIDVAIAAISITPERLETLDFTTVYFLTEDAILSKDAGAVVNSPLDLANRRIGVQNQSVYQAWAQAELVDTGLIAPSNLIVYREIERSTDDLEQGLLDFVMLDLPPAELAAERRGFSIAGQGLNTQRLGIALPKGAYLLQAELNRALGELQAVARIEELAKAYMGLEKEDLIPVPTPNPVPPTPVPQPPPPPPSACIDGMEWVSDLNLDDNGMQNPPVMQPGQPFVKGWRVRNSGTCTWDGSYALVYVSGNTPYASMGGQPAPVERQIVPGETNDFNVSLVAPLVPGTYQGFWAMRNGNGALFGDRMWVGITVQGVATPTPPPTQTPSPNIEFTVDRTSITQGECVNFSWNVQNVQAVYFYADGQDWQIHGVPGSGSQIECPQATTNYNLRVVFGDGTVEVSRVRIDVAPAAVDAPVITYFAVNPEGQIYTGQCVSISWDVQGQVNTTLIKRNNADLWNPAPQGGNIEDCPPGSGGYAYTLEANGPGGVSRAQRTVNVVQPAVPQPTNTPLPDKPQPAPPVINAFSVTPNQVQVGGCVQVAWRVSGGTTLVQILRNGVIVLDNGPWEGAQQDCLSAEGNYAYRLLASNSAGQQLSQEGTVSVQASAPQNPLAGTSWRVATYWNGSEMAAVLPGTNLTAGFRPDGGVDGSSGCNNYSSVYSVNGGVISIVPPSATHRMCAEPAGVMEQEHTFLNALASALTFRIEADRLYISDSNRVVIEFVRQ